MKTSDQIALELAQHHQELENEIKLLRYKTDPRVLKAQLRDVIEAPALIKGVITMVNPLNSPSVKEKMHQVKDAAQTLVSDVKETVSATTQTVKEGVHSAVTSAKDTVTGDTVREVATSATDAVKSGFATAKEFVSDKAEKVKSSVKEKVGSANGIRQGVHHVQSSVTDNPLMTTLIASGVALTAAGVVMLANSSRQKPQPYNLDKYVDRFIDEGNPNVGQGFIEDDSTNYTSAKESYNPPHQTQNLTKLLHRQPLLVGSAALLVGAAIGVLLPRSSYENRMVGQASDRLIRDVKDQVSGTLQEVRLGAKQQVEEFKQVANEAGYEVKETLLKSLAAI